MVPHIEKAPEQGREVPPNVDSISARLAELKSKKDEKEMTKEEYKRNLDEIRLQIEKPQGLENASVEDIARLRTELESLAVEVDSAQPEAQSTASASVEEQETWYKPQTWTPETKGKVQALGWAAAIGFVGVLAWRALKKKTKEVTTAVEEKVSEGWSGVKIAIGTTIAVGLTYIGIRIWQDIDKLNDLKKELDSWVKALPTLKGEKLQEAQQKIQELQREIQDIKNGVTPKSNDAKTAAEKNRKKAEEMAEAARENARKIAENPAAQESAENAKRYAYVKGMLLFEPPQATWTASEGTKHAQLTDTIHENRERPIEEILAARTPPFTIKEGAGDLPSRQQASLYLWKFCQKHRNVLVKYTSKDGDKPMTLDMFLAKVAQSYTAATSIDEAIRGAEGNVFTAIQNFDTKKIMTDGALKDATKEYIEESMIDAGLTEDEIDQLDWAQLVQIFTSTTGSIAGSTRVDEGTTVSKILLKLHEKLKDKDRTEVHKYMLPFFHQILPRANWDSTNNQNNLDRVHEYLIEKMPMHQALRCAFYAHLMKQGNPTGIVLMQAEILKYVAHEEESPLFSMDKQFVISRIGETMIALSTGKISDEWKALNIDPKMLERGLGVLKDALEKGAETGAKVVAGGAWEGGKQVLAPIVDHPVESVGLTAAVVTAATIYGQHRLDTHRFIESLKAATKRRGMQNVYRSSELLTKRKAALEAMEKIVELIGHEKDTTKVAAAMEVLDEFTKGTRSAAALTNLERSLTRIMYPTEELIAALDTLKLHQRTLQFFRIPIRAATLAARVPAGILRGAGKGLKFMGKSVPYAAAAYEGISYEYFEKEAMQKQFDAEKDPLKRKIIRNEMLAKRENWILSAASSPFAFTNPFGATIFFGNIARQEANESINEGTRYMLQDRSEMMDKTLGSLLHEVQKSAPGSAVTFGQAMSATHIGGILSEGNVSNMHDTFDAANTSARSEAYAAYFKQNAFLPPVSADMLTEEEAMDPARSEQRLKILAEDQVNYFTQSALSYLSHVTDRTFVTVDPEILHRATMYAHRCSLDWRLQMLDQETTFTKKDWAGKEAILTDIATHENDERVALAHAHIESGEKAQDVLPFFFLESLKDNLAMCEMAILSADYSNWSYWDLNPFDTSSHEEMMQAARTMFAEKITATLEKICAASTPLTRESFESGRELLASVLKSDPNALAQEGFSRSDKAGIIEIGADSTLLSVDGILGYLQMYSAGPQTTLDS